MTMFVDLLSFSMMLAASGLLLLVSVSALYAMNPRTCHWIRLSHILMSVGSFGTLTHLLATDWHPSLWSSIAMFGMSLLIGSDKRRAFRREPHPR